MKTLTNRLNESNKEAIKDFTSSMVLTFVITSIPVQIFVRIDYVDAVLTLFTLSL
jgi:hypothetical protein